MENDKIQSSEESFALIQRMIKTAQHEIEDDSFYYLLWGWAVFISCILNYVLMQVNYEIPEIGWIVIMPIGAIVSMIYGAKKGKKVKVKSYIDSLMKYVLISFLVSLGMVLFFMFKLQLNTYPMVLMIYGFWLFISGGALKFKPLIIGGVLNWILAIVSFFVQFKFQLILVAIAVLIGYIIPGHMLKNKFKHSS